MIRFLRILRHFLAKLDGFLGHKMSIFPSNMPQETINYGQEMSQDAQETCQWVQEICLGVQETG